MDEFIQHGHLQRARQYAAEGKWLHAIQVYRHLLSEDPACDDAWVELASAYAALQRTDAAEDVLLERASASASPEPYLFVLASLLYRAGRSTDAYRHFVRVLRVEHQLEPPVRSRLHAFLGSIFGEQRKWSVAEYHFRTVMAIDPTFPRIHESLAEVLIHRGQLDEADNHLRKALVEEPYSWTGHYLRGLLEARRHHWEAGLAAFTQAADLDPREPRAWHKCGEMLLQLKRLQESERYLRKALELSPTLTDAVVAYGLLALELGDLERAGELFAQALAAEPTHRRAAAGVRSVARALQRSRENGR